MPSTRHEDVHVALRAASSATFGRTPPTVAATPPPPPALVAVRRFGNGAWRWGRYFWRNGDIGYAGTGCTTAPRAGIIMTAANIRLAEIAITTNSAEKPHDA